MNIRDNESPLNPGRFQGAFRRFSLALALGLLSLSLPVAMADGSGDSGAASPTYREGAGDAAPADIPLASLAPLVKRVKPGVVNVYTLSVVPARHRRQAPYYFDPMDQLFRELFEGQVGTETRQSLGSGFILNAEGLVVTNNHVVDGADAIRVGLADGREFSARPVGVDPKTDLALLKLTGDGVKDLPVVSLGDSDALEVGDFALAVGNPFGLDHSVSLGIVSAKERVIGAGPYDDFIQTDTAINPGNSGGPLFNLKGEVVGVNTAIMAQGQGIGFAVPVNMLKTLLPQLAKGRVQRGWLGVSVQDVPPTLTKRLGLEKAEGAFVLGVIRQGPAHLAGLKPGDVVVSVGGRKVVSYNQFSREVAALTPGEKAMVTVVREGQTKTFEATVGHRPDERPPLRPDVGVSDDAPREDGARGGSQGGVAASRTGDGVDLGVTLKAVSRSDRRRLGIPGGVEIVSVDGQSPLAKGDVHPGDVILEMQRRPVRDLSDFAAIAEELRSGERLLLRLQRGDTAIYVAVKL